MAYMHPHAAVIEKLYTCLDRHDAEGMAECYHPDATFQDIAFTLRGLPEIRGMWRMIAQTDLRATFQVLYADDSTAVADLVDVYTFSETRNRVHNSIRSEFRFRDGRIVEHRDICSVLHWGVQAFGPFLGVILWLVPPLRRWMAMRKLKKFMAKNP